MPTPDLSLFAPLREAYEASRSVRTPEDLVAVLQRVGAIVSKHLGWSTVVVHAHRRAWDDFEVAAVHGNPEARELLLGTRRTWEEWAPLFSDRFARNGAYFIPQGAGVFAASDLLDRRTAAPAPAHSDAWHPQDGLLVVMRGGDEEIVGVLSVDDPDSGMRPTDSDIDALVAVANAAGAALHQAREASRDAEHRAALEHLLTVSTTLAHARSGTRVLETVCAGIRDALGFERVAIELADENGELCTAAQVGWDEVPAAPFMLGQLEAIFGPEHSEHGCHLLERTDALSLLGMADGSYRSQRNGSGPWGWRRHWLLVPLRDPSGRLIGFIWPDDPRDCLRPDTARLQALRLFADQAQAALEAASHYEQTLHLAQHDHLTGLPNRRVLLDRLQHALVRARRSEGTVAVLFVDVDRFKAVNDTYGHEVGDEVLRLAGARIDEALRPGDTVARLGGDEFVVLCEDVRDGDGALDVARRLRVALARPLDVGTTSVSITASVGVALPSGASDDAAALLRDADVAMYRAKDAGRDAEELASPAMRAGASARAQLERALGGALAREEIELYWQPIVAVADARAVRVEALCRWNHPGLGWVSPLEFIPIAEDTGFIVELGRWVLERACAQWAHWRELHGTDAPGVAVNLSPRQLNDPYLLELVAGLTARHRMPSGALCAEITESALLDAGRATEQALAGLRSLGVAIELDDFGTGFSSLSSLERFHFDGLKIDRSFVTGRHRDARAGDITEALLAMARTLGLRAVAEGVETAEQLAWLVGAGCELAQGFYFARPQPAAGIDAMIGRQLPLVADRVA